MDPLWLGYTGDHYQSLELVEDHQTGESLNNNERKCETFFADERTESVEDPSRTLSIDSIEVENMATEEGVVIEEEDVVIEKEGVVIEDEGVVIEEEVEVIDEENNMEVEEDMLATEQENLSGQTQEMISQANAGQQAEEQVDTVSVWSGTNVQLSGQPGIVVVSGVDSDTSTIVSLRSPNLSSSSSSSGWNPNLTLEERLNEEKIGSLRPSTHLRGSRIPPSWLLRLNLNSVDESEEAETVGTPEKAGVVVTEVRVEAEAEAVVRPPEKAGTERRSSKKAGAVVGPTEEAGAVVGPTEEAEGAASKGGTLKRGRGNRRTAQTGPKQVSDNVSGKERAGGKGNPKRKRSDLDDTSVPAPKRIKKCRAVHGVEQKELWCRPCINSKKCEKYT